MIKLFIKQCLFFSGRETMYRILGIVGWAGIILVSYVAFIVVIFGK